MLASLQHVGLDRLGARMISILRWGLVLPCAYWCTLAVSVAAESVAHQWAPVWAFETTMHVLMDFIAPALSVFLGCVVAPRSPRKIAPYLAGLWMALLVASAIHDRTLIERPLWTCVMLMLCGISAAMGVKWVRIGFDPLLNAPEEKRAHAPYRSPRGTAI